MSYELVREQLNRYKKSAGLEGEDQEALLEALNKLTVALETDLTQIKVAIAQLARLIERQT